MSIYMLSLSLLRTADSPVESLNLAMFWKAEMEIQSSLVGALEHEWIMTFHGKTIEKP